MCKKIMPEPVVKKIIDTTNTVVNPLKGLLTDVKNFKLEGLNNDTLVVNDFGIKKIKLEGPSKDTLVIKDSIKPQDGTKTITWKEAVAKYKNNKSD